MTISYERSIIITAVLMTLPSQFSSSDSRQTDKIATRRNIIHNNFFLSSTWLNGCSENEDP